MKLAINMTLSLAMLALCAWLLWPNAGTRHDLHAVFATRSFSHFAPYLAGYVGLLVVVQLFRSLRWNNLLAPLGVKVPTAPLLAISAVGFMAILALPARLGEFVRPGLLRKRGDISASAALGTVAVERIVDGLVVSLFVFGALFARRGPDAPRWMMPMAYGALGGFSVALVFLVLAVRKPVATVHTFLKLSLLPRISPRIARILEGKLLEMIRGLVVLRDPRNLGRFLLWSAIYWVANGLGVFVLAKAFDLNLSLVGAFATMGVCAVGIMLPNPPGLVGLFQGATLLGLSVYLGPAVLDKHATDPAARDLYAAAFAFANLHYLLQLVWYVMCGAIGLASPYVSFHDLVTAKASAKLAPVGASGDDPPHDDAPVPAPLESPPR